jgi:hypothetical protein
VPPKKKPAIKPKAKAISPLLRSAFEVLNHGLWHFFRSDTTTDMKFALLHVDQAIELILKERVRAGGKSIYKNPKETISMYGAYEALQAMQVQIPERADLELLHEERNSIQHKYANPNAEDAAFHIEKAIEFICRFVGDELKLDVKEYVSAEFIDEVLGK